MSTDNAQPLKTTAQTTPEGVVNDTFDAEPIVHKGDWSVQSDDGNELYHAILSTVQQLHNDPNEDGEPFTFGPINPPHIAGSEEYYVGIKSHRGGLGEMKNGRFTGWYEYNISLYETEEGENKPNTPAKATLTVKKRQRGMVTKSGDAYTWAKDDDGNHHDGTLLELSASYVQNEDEADEVIRAYLAAVLDRDTVNKHYNPIPATFHLGQGEVHYRVARKYERGIVQSIQSSFSLMEFEGAGIESRAKAERGRYGIKRIDATPGAFDLIGFETPEALEGKGIMLKAYNTLNVHQRSDDDPLKNPKVEAALKGTVHVRHLDTLVEHLGRIVASHLRYAGVGEDDLVADDHFDPTGSITYKRPSEEARTGQLEDFLNAPGLRRSIEYNLYHRESDAFRDILHALYERDDEEITYYNPTKEDDHLDGGKDAIPENRDESYDGLVEATGLRYETVRKYVEELVEKGILRRIRGIPTRITWRTRKAFEAVREAFETEGRTPNQQREEREDRRDERREETADPDSEDHEDELEESESAPEWVQLTDHPLGEWELLETARKYGDIEDDDIALRR